MNFLIKEKYKQVLVNLDLKESPDDFQFSDFSDYTKFCDKNKDERLVQSLKAFFELLAIENFRLENLNRYTIDFMISKIDDFIQVYLDIILHHPKFQKAESLWRSIDFLVERTDFNSNVEIDLLEASKEELICDFEDALDITQSSLYQHVYVNEYDMPGGKPYSVILSNYEFNTTHSDINLLKEISSVASSAHCPFLGSVGPNFFEKKDMDSVSKIQDLKEFFQRPEYIRWNQFRETENARFIGLTIPKFLLRLPYGKGNPVKNLYYEESVEGSNSYRYVWGSAAFAFVSNLTKSFKQHGWTVGIRGPESGGKVDDLLVHHHSSPRGVESKMPVEMLIPERKELELAELGLIPFSYYKHSNYGCFFSANSVHKPGEFSDVNLSANAKVNARLPYIFLASRIGHYLKVLQRENLGGIKDKNLLEHELNAWLNTLVTAMPNPSLSLISKRPLRDGKIQVSELEESPGMYKVEFYVVPHFQVEGMDIKLSLVSKLPILNHQSL